MADEQDPSIDSDDDQGVEDQQQQEFLIPLEERIDALEPVAHRVHGYVTPEGYPNYEGPLDKVVEAVEKAVVKRRSDRGKISITRPRMMKYAWPQLPGPGEWDDQEDPDACAGLYKRLNTRIWRWLDSNAGGAVQSRLNDGYILVRTTSTAEKTQGVYITKDWMCLQTDWTTPDKQGIKAAVTKMGRNAELGAERLPEHAKRFRRELTTGVKTALEAGIVGVNSQIESAENNGGPPSDDEDE